MALKVGSVVSRVRRHWLTVAFFLGFVTDVILLNRIDDLVDNLILLTYAILATLSLILFYLGAAERVGGFLSEKLKRFSPVLMQYAFGGLFSGMLIFYGRSGDWVASAPYLLLILAVIAGNELLDKRSNRLLYYIALYFIGIFSYVVLVVPVVLGRMGDGIFILSGLIALVIVGIVVQLLFRIIPNFMRVSVHRVILVVGFLYVGFNALYFTNTIPPIPLSLTQLEVVQSVARMADGNYTIVSEVQPWYRQLPFVRTVIHPTGGSIACFARVYAPTRLETTIYHRWEYQDPDGQWRERFRLGYPISGRNEGGYRGYTQLQSYSNGIWRCSVETERGQVLGRKTVRVVTGELPKETLRRIE